MDNSVYQVTGYMHGTFTGDDGKKIAYANLFCLQKLEGDQRSDYKFDGYKAFTFKCASPEVLEGIQFQDHVELFFDRRGKVAMIKIVE